ncbi:MAG: TetR/AcrR family transcriptional regulator, partial [Erysipelothrix sp.]|nr:TetR/AcrR family transcriptional regulator [Erysipelothrix sp.]
ASKEAILSVGKEIVSQSGINALNMRNIAQRCNISVGSVYNYFPSKGDLIIATIESVWQEIIYDSQNDHEKLGFTETMAQS